MYTRTSFSWQGHKCVHNSLVVAYVSCAIAAKANGHESKHHLARHHEDMPAENPQHTFLFVWTRTLTTVHQPLFNSYRAALQDTVHHSLQRKDAPSIYTCI
jgi:hypothetical protein